MNATAVLEALAYPIPEKQGETLIKRTFKVKAETVVDALADMLAEEEQKTLSQH